MPKWGALALELAQRAARYGKAAEDSNNFGVEEHTPITFEELTAANLTQPKDAQWWWPQVPLLTALLEGAGRKNSSIATWVSLGRYRFDKSSGMKLDWTTFLCSALSGNKTVKGSIKNGLAELTKDIGNGTGNGTSRTLLSTTELVDALSEKAEERPLAPLLLCFKKRAPLFKTIHSKQKFIICRWEDLRSSASVGSTATVDQPCPYCNSASCIPNTCHEFAQDSYQLNGTRWFQHLTPHDKQGHCRRIKNFAAWLLALQTRPQWDVILTVPAWNPDHLPGVHVGAIVVYVRKKKWISKSLDQDTPPENLIDQIGAFSAAFRAGATIAMQRELEQYRKISEQVEKQAQMLKLVESPLKRLSEALETMQEDTQTLRSILYDPHRTLFAVAPLVRDYFEEARWCSYGRVRWKGIHKPDSLTAKADQHAAGATIAAIICHLFGMVPKGDEDEKELYGRVAGLLESQDPAFAELRKVLEIVLFAPSQKSVFLSMLSGCLLSQATSSASDITVISNAIKNIKLYVFTPFKYSGDTPIGPMALIFYDYNFEETFDQGPITDTIAKPIKGKKPLFPDGSLPVPRYSDMLSLLAGILAYARNEKGAKVDHLCVEKNMYMLVSFDQNVFEIEQLKATFQLMKTVAKEGLRKPHGNFRKPLLDFASVLSVDSSMINEDITFNNFSLSIKYHGYRTSLCFEPNSFCLTVEAIKP